MTADDTLAKRLEMLGEHGVEPEGWTPERYRSLGHTQMNSVKAIRLTCLACSGNSPSEVRPCPALDSNLWPFRMGYNPHRNKKVDTEAMRASAKRLRA
jgi:hypothetical protein